MKAASHLDRLLAGLRRRGLDEVEVYTKEGRSRRLEFGPQGVISSQSTEAGWAVRASSARASLFAAGSGSPREGATWPAPDGYALELPPPLPVPPWREPRNLDAPLMVESEAKDMLEGIDRALRAELPRAALLRAALEDGASVSDLASSTGVRAAVRARGASLSLEAALAEGGRWIRVSDLLAAREPSLLRPQAVARRLADRLSVRKRGRPAERDRSSCILSPPVAARFLGGLLPLFLEGALGDEGPAQGTALGSKWLTVIDDPGLETGLLAAPVDGEGVPGREVKLVEQGVLADMLSDWRGRDPTLSRPAGCARRPSWREAPRPGPSHLYVQPDSEVTAASLLDGMSRGYYALDLDGPPELDFSSDRVRMVSAGFLVRGGRAERPVSRAVLSGRISSALRGIQAVARDLEFFPLGAMIGSPSMLLQSLEIDSE